MDYSTQLNDSRGNQHLSFELQQGVSFKFQVANSAKLIEAMDPVYSFNQACLHPCSKSFHSLRQSCNLAPNSGKAAAVLDLDRQAHRPPDFLADQEHDHSTSLQGGNMQQNKRHGRTFETITGANKSWKVRLRGDSYAWDCSQLPRLSAEGASIF